jgi:hypothetical protein
MGQPIYETLYVQRPGFFHRFCHRGSGRDYRRLRSKRCCSDHKCDPISDVGWTVVAAEETLSQVDSAPFQAGASGNWFIDRATTVLPFCHYYNAIGIYSMRSYSLAPRETTERIGICEAAAQGGSAAVPPYAGPCPPK